MSVHNLQTLKPPFKFKFNVISNHLNAIKEDFQRHVNDTTTKELYWINYIHEYQGLLNWCSKRGTFYATGTILERYDKFDKFDMKYLIKNQNSYKL